MNHHHRDLRRVARSAECSAIGTSPTEPEVIERLVRRARAAGVVVFTKSMLEQMAPFDRFVVEGAHKRICERSR